MTEQMEHNQQVIGQFSQQAADYSRLTASVSAEDRKAAFRALVGPGPNDLVLDICCGPGHTTLDFAPFVAHATGLDLTPAMLDQARAAQARAGISNVTWLEGDACALPFDDGDFSIVLCGSAFHHLSDPAVALREMTRVCRQGGRIVVRDVTPAADKVTAYDEMEVMRDPSHTHALTIEELRALGAALPVSGPALSTSITELPLDSVLAASYPETCSIADISAIFHEDALSGKDRLGFAARLVNGEIRVAYPVTTSIWIKN